MKRLFLLAALGLATATAMPVSAAELNPKKAPKDDTVLVKLANGAKMSLVVKDTEQLKSFQNYSLDSLMVMLTQYISEAEKMEKKNVNGEDYTVSFRPAEETKDKSRPEKISITFQDDQNDQNSEKKGVFISVDYDDKKTVKISSDPNLNCDPDSTSKAKDKPKKASRYNKGLHFDLGFNTLLNDKGTELDQVGLKPWGSRYISFNPYYEFRIGKEKSPLNLRTGLEFSFHNYMFDRSHRMVDTDDLGASYTTLVKDPRNLEKSKLATSTVSLPLMAIFDFKNSKNRSVVRIGAGGFVGYRIGSHTKIKYNQEGKTIKDKDHGNFNLEELQYGLKATLGFYGVDLFANYNLNTLFKENRGPEANVLSFGITI